MQNGNDTIILSRRQLMADRLYRLATLLIFSIGTVLFIFFMSQIAAVGQDVKDLIADHEKDRAAASARSAEVVSDAIEKIDCRARNRERPVEEARRLCN